MEFPDSWEDIGGRLGPSESPEEGLRREIFEETGIKDIEIIKPLTMFHVFRHNEKKAEILHASLPCYPYLPRHLKLSQV